jgi:DNA-binding XRE family transcriptional regulator
MDRQRLKEIVQECLHYRGLKQEGGLEHNTVRKIREKLLMSRAELARKAGISPLTIDRIEKGLSCRIETKRKIILAFGYGLSDKGWIFATDAL